MKNSRITIQEVFFDSDADYDEVFVKGAEPIDELEGSLKPTDEHDKLMNQVLEGDKDTVDHGKLILESINQGVGNFTPDLMMEQLVKNYEITKRMMGERIIQQLTNYSQNYVDKNIKIPEFQREIRDNIEENIGKLKEKELIDKEGQVTDKGLALSSLVMYTEELDHLIPKGFGDRRKKEKEHYGDKEEFKNFEKSRYRDIAVRQTIKTAIRRGHTEVQTGDIKIYDKKSKGKISIVYGLDASGSMKGAKLGTAKKAGVALAFKAINDKNKVGLLVFGSEIKNKIEPTKDFMRILANLANIKAAMETDLGKTIKEAIDMFPSKNETRHLVLLTDALPTKGQAPIDKTLQAASIARNEGITISVIGIKLDEEGEKLAKRIVEIGEGRLYKVTDIENMDQLILEDYYSLN